LFFAACMTYDIYRQAGCGRSASLRRQLENELNGKGRKNSKAAGKQRGNAGGSSAGDASLGHDELVVSDVQQNPMVMNDSSRNSSDFASVGSGDAALEALLGRPLSDSHEEDVAAMGSIAARLLNDAIDTDSGAAPVAELSKLVDA